MTVIAGIQTTEGVYIAGDSACIGVDYDMFLRAEPKVFKCGDFVLGAAGGGRIMDVAKYVLEIPTPKIENIHKYMRTTFIDAVREALNNSGSSRTEEGSESLDGNYLVGYKNELFVILSDFSVHSPRQTYAAIGAGGVPAAGALFALNGLDKGPIAQLTIAMKSAEEFNASVRAPFYYVSTTGESGEL